MDAFWSAPPVSRTLVAAVVLTSVAIYGHFFAFINIAFLPQLLYKTFPPQLWRLATPFWLSGPKFNMIMDPIFLWQYSSNLETASPRFQRKGDFFVYVVFVKAVILLLSGVLLGNYIFMDALLLAFAYTFSQDNPHGQQTFFVLSFPTRYLPLVMLALTFVMTGGDLGRVYNQATGLIAAHAYDFLTRIWPTFGGGANWVEKLTPQAIRTAFGEGAPGVGREQMSRGFGTAWRSAPPQTVGTSAPGGSSSGGWSSGSSWGTRGSGRRLG